MFGMDKNLDTLVDKINIELSKIVSWLHANKMSLNVEKTHFMLFRPRNKIVPNIKIYMDGCEISEVETTKFLGVLINNKLDWKYHINYICTKVSKNIGIILKARKSFNNDTLLMLYYSLVYPYLTYCIHVWGSSYATHISRLFILQKKLFASFMSLSHYPTLIHYFSSLVFSKLKKYISIILHCLCTSIICLYFRVCFKKCLP